MPGIDPERPFRPLNIALLTVSDSRSPAEDRSGDLLAERLAKAGHRLADRALVVDDAAQIAARFCAWIADPAVDVVISTGGTGVTGRWWSMTRPRSRAGSAPGSRTPRSTS